MIRLLKRPVKMNYLHRGLKIKTINLQKQYCLQKYRLKLTTKEDRMRTCYMQACLAYVNFEGISNSDIRKIFGLGEKEKAKT